MFGFRGNCGSGRRSLEPSKMTHVVTLQRNFRQSGATGCARVASRIAGPGQTFAASSLFMARDADGDTITKIALWDTGTGGGHFVVNGVAAPNVEIDVTAAAQLACR